MWLDYTTLNVGDEVSVAVPGNWNTRSQGVYTVVKVGKIKIKIVVQRKSDGYERVFSVKRRTEMNSKDSYRAPYLESMATMQERDQRVQREREVAQAWSKAEQAGRDRNLSALRQAVADLELLTA